MENENNLNPFMEIETRTVVPVNLKKKVKGSIHTALLLADLTTLFTFKMTETIGTLFKLNMDDTNNE